jgi:hypothetical protein
MLGTILSFLGGSTVRMVWGEVSAYLTARQDHRYELERLELQGRLDAAQHDRNQAAIRLQAELGVQTIRVQGEVDVDKLAALTFDKAVEQTGKSTGFVWIDAWNASIKAALATEVMLMLGLHYYRVGWVLDDRGWELAGAVLGVYLADRFLFRRNK